MTASRSVATFGMWTAWATAVLYAVYLATLFAGGVASGVPREPYLTGAEILTVVGAVLQVALFAAIHESARSPQRLLSLIALGWMFAMATLTAAVHVAQLAVGRRIDLTAMPQLRFVFGWEWPSLLYGVELTAWHLLFGLALVFAAPVFRERGLTAAVRVGFYVAGALCLLGVVGLAGDLSWRFIGVFGYGVVFPITCVALGFVFRNAARAGSQSSSHIEMREA